MYWIFTEPDISLRTRYFWFLYSISFNFFVPQPHYVQDPRTCNYTCIVHVILCKHDIPDACFIGQNKETLRHIADPRSLYTTEIEQRTKAYRDIHSDRLNGDISCVARYQTIVRFYTPCHLFEFPVLSAFFLF